MNNICTNKASERKRKRKSEKKNETKMRDVESVGWFRAVTMIYVKMW